MPTSSPLATRTDRRGGATVRARTRRPRSNQARSAKPGAPASAAPKSPPHGGAAITRSVTASMRDHEQHRAAPGPSPDEQAGEEDHRGA